MHIYCPPLDTVTVSRPMWLLYILFIVIAYKMSFYDNPPIDLFTLPPDVVHSSHFLRSISQKTNLGYSWKEDSPLSIPTHHLSDYFIWQCVKRFSICLNNCLLEKNLKATMGPSLDCNRHLLFFLQDTGQDSRLRIEYQRSLHEQL